MTAPGNRTHQGLAVLGAAVAFGIAADLLGRTVPGRLDVALGLVALVLAGGAIVQRELLPAPAALAPLGVPFAFLAGALIWRDSATLFALNLGGIALLATLASPRVRAAGRRRSSLADYLQGALQLLGGTAAGAAPLVFTEIDWRALPDGGPVHRLRGTMVGLVAAVPVAVVFGGLLMEADPVFDRLLTSALGAELDQLAGHGVAILAWTWLGAGALRLLLLRPADRRDGVAAGGRFGIIEVGTVLLLVDLLFLAFVAVQFRYLFGGAALVNELAGLSYAEYARQGFFQLVAVATLSLPLLLLADWALGRRDPASVGRFRLLAAVMLALLNVMLASALYRMRLYTAEYGLTELRLYTTAFMGWLVLVLGWFGATVLRGRRERFGFGAVAAGLFVLGTLNLVNPDGLIA
ncbi:MAG TPA: DUF4173 domain-containing protein, partial [Gemmatimonadales bacterium]|nr:DUF4173 domain-containing protein [Gemmatimonadales bacterium]